MRGPPSWLERAFTWRSRSPSASGVTAASSMKIPPEASIETETGSWSCSSAAALLSGRSTWTPAVSKGAVTMKMISSTSMTSTIGVTLISDIGDRRPRRPAPRMGPIAILGIHLQLAAQGAVEAVGEALEAGLEAIDAVAEAVVGDHRRDGGEQTDRGREQGLGDARGDDGEAGALGVGDGGEAAHDAEHRAEQADERRDRTDRGEDVEARGEPVGLGCHRRMHRHREARARALFVDGLAASRAAPFGDAGGEHLGRGNFAAAALLVEAVNIF